MNNSNPEETVKLFKHFLDLLSARADLETWNKEIPWEPQKHNLEAGGFELYPIENSYIESILLLTDTDKFISQCDVKFKDGAKGIELWPYFKELFGKFAVAVDRADGQYIEKSKIFAATEPDPENIYTVIFGDYTEPLPLGKSTINTYSMILDHYNDNPPPPYIVDLTFDANPDRNPNAKIVSLSMVSYS